MPNLLIRNLDCDVLSRLRAAARAHGRSLQSEIHAALQSATARRLAETRRISRQWFKQLNESHHSDSTELIREARQKR
jgi:plasmid stability protein